MIANSRIEKNYFDGIKLPMLFEEVVETLLKVSEGYSHDDRQIRRS